MKESLGYSVTALNKGILIYLTNLLGMFGILAQQEFCFLSNDFFLIIYIHKQTMPFEKIDFNSK